MVENLKVEQHKDALKKAKGEVWENTVSPETVKSVDNFIKTLKEAAKDAGKENKEENRQKEKKEKREVKAPSINETWQRKEEIDKKYENREITQMEKATMVAFINNAPAMIDAITKNIVSNFEKLKKTDIDTLDEAKKAFEEDIAGFKNKPFYTEVTAGNNNMLLLDTNIKEFKTQIELKKIEMIPGYAKTLDKIQLENLQKSPTLEQTWATKDKIGKQISEGMKANEDKEKDKLEILLNSPPSNEIAKQLFETNKEARDALIKKNRNSTDTNKTTQQNNFEELLKLYAGEYKSYGRKNYMNTTENINNRDPKYTYLEAKNDKEEKNEFMFWSSTEGIHRARAEAYKSEAKRESERKIVDTEGKPIKPEDIDKTIITNNLKTIDGKWSYATFDNILRTQTDPTAFLKDLLGKNLLETIDGFKAPIDRNNKADGYYGVILGYIAEKQDEWLLTTYLNHVIVGNALHTEYLWSNGEAQTRNFNKIVAKRTIDPKSDNGKKLEQLKWVVIKNVSPKNREESLSKWFDSVIEKFWPLIFGIMRLLGISKWTLLKRFWDNEKFREKINEMFSKEYKLSTGQETHLEEIVNGNEVEKKEGKEQFSSKSFNLSLRPYSWEELQKKFDETNKTKYIKRLTEGDHYKYMNVSVLQNALDNYNKDKKQSIKMSDIVTTTMDGETKKETIKDIKDTKEFKEIITNRMDNEKTRTNIASANKEIQTPTKDKDKIINEDIQWLSLDADETKKYIIQSQNDIARYLTASLFSDKDLGFVMTENQLHNDETIENKDIVTKKPEEKFTENRNAIKNDRKLDKEKTTYWTFDYSNNFEYKADATGDQKDYQDNILNTLKTIMTDKDQLPILTKNLSQDTTKQYDRIFTDPIHLTNMLTMIDKTTNADIIDKLKEAKNTTIKIDNGNIVMTIAEKGTVTLSQETKDDKINLKTERKAIS